MLTDSIVTSDTPCQDFKPLYKTHESVLGTHGTGLDRESVLARNRLGLSARLSQSSHLLTIINHFV